MTRDEARKQIQDMLGHRKDLVDDIERALRFVQEELESEATLPFFLRVVDDSLSTTADENIIQRPQDFIRFWDDDPFSLIFTDESGGAATNFPLKKGSQKYLREAFSGETRTMGYSEVGEEFQLFPTPTDAWPLVISYYGKDRVLDSNIENKWLRYLSGLMIGRAGFIVATGIRDKDAQAFFGALAAAGTEKLNQMSTAQDEAGGRWIMGGED